MEISVTLKEKTLMVMLKGELDHHSADEVKTMIETVIINRGVKNLIFDFSHLTFMDSSGIGVIVGRYKMITALGGRVAIVGIKRNVDKLLTMSGIKKIIETYETKDMALKKFQEELS